MSAPLTRSDVDRIAALARLDLTDAERDRFVQQLGAILEYAGQVLDVDTSAALAQPASADARQPVREDQQRRSLDRADVLDEAPGANTDAGLFTVPRVLGP